MNIAIHSCLQRALQPFIACLFLPLCPLLPTTASRAVEPPGDTFLFGGDISALTVIEKADGVFRTDGHAGDAIGIMTDHGANCFRLRLFVNPTGRNVVVNDLPYTVALAKRIKAAGAKILLNFHYSDTWADPGHQTKPAAWAELDFDALEQRVFEHTRNAVAEMRRQNVLPDIVQIGNEITPGILWPEGKLYGVGSPEEQWQKFARLLKAGVRGVKEASEGEQVSIMLHIDKGGSWAATQYFFDRIESNGVPFDIIGLSFYPWWHGTLEDLTENLKKCAHAYRKQLFVVETAYPWRTWNHGQRGDRAQRADEAMRWPHTPEGQRQFVADLASAVRDTPHGLGMGVLWWYPEAIPVSGVRVWNGGATALFNADGEPLPAQTAHMAVPQEQE